MLTIRISENEFKDYLRENDYSPEEAENFASLFLEYTKETELDSFRSLYDITIQYGVEKLEDGELEEQELLRNDKYRLYYS